MELKKRIDFLRQEIEKYNYNYYVLDKSLITDFEFDDLLKELIDLETKNPQFDDNNSPTKKVGGLVVNSFNSFKHNYPMLSLSNTYSESELIDFDKRVKKVIKEPEYVCELKYDGVSISLEYRHGKLVKALTRGDGNSGDDVIHNVRTIKSIPLNLFGLFPNHFFIRGEIFLKKTDFNLLNKSREVNNLEKFSNARNTASGSIKMQNSSEVAKRNLSCYLYSILGENLPYETHYNNIKESQKWGFKISKDIYLSKDIKGVVQFVNMMGQRKDKLPYEVDGVVIKVNSTFQQKKLGFTSKFPRWAIAYKFKTQNVKTKLKSISFQVGRTGSITPVANLEPVNLSGTIIKRASLHNSDFISKLDIRINDYVFVEKGGEIIPKITSVDFNNRKNLNSKKFIFINECPSCKSVLSKEEEEANHYCLNDFCPPKIKGGIEHFISRRAMNIDGIGSETIDLLYEKGLLAKISDLYYLEKDKLIILDRLGEKSVENILNGIEKSKEIVYERVLFALGIRFVGETVAKKLAKKFKNINILASASYEDLKNTDEIGEKIARSIIDYFSKRNNLIMINDLIKKGLSFKTKENSKKSNILINHSFVISGIFENHSREEMKKIIVENGGKCTNSISKKTSFLIIGNNFGPSKKKKAEELGIDTITGNFFLELYKLKV